VSFAVQETSRYNGTILYSQCKVSIAANKTTATNCIFEVLKNFNI